MELDVKRQETTLEQRSDTITREETGGKSRGVGDSWDERQDVESGSTKPVVA